MSPTGRGPFAAALLLVSASATSVHAQTPAQRPASGAIVLTLNDALQRAEASSEGVRIARAGVLRARGQQYQARAQLLPQLAGSLQYQKTLQSQFKEIGKRAASLSAANPAADTLRPVCTLNARIPKGATAAERNAALATAVTEGCGGGGLEDSPIARIFAAEQTITVGLQGSWTLFAGGRISAANRIASASRRSAEIGLASARATLQLDVTQAYYDAALAARLSEIADSSLQQSERTLSQVTLARNVGNTSEFERLRAQVTRDNQRPVAIQRHTQRDIALLRLKQLLDLPANQDVVLSTTATEAVTAAIMTSDDRSADSALVREVTLRSADTTVESRAQVRQLAENVRIQESAFRIARAQRLPAVVLSTQYGRTGYPKTMGNIPRWNDFFPNWTVTAAVSVPVFTGGRITGEEMEARANLEEARESHQQIRELAELDARSAIAELEQAQAAWLASQGTSEQAARAYTIAEVRYREGISTQLELSQSRLLLQEAEANRAYAARNLLVARARLSLLRDLPLGGSSQQGGASAASFTQQQMQTPSAQQGQSAFTTTSFGGQQP
ncbi:MAG TPA: TolC family protein [Gemmatimonadaceae bacterium]|nr:TolC family protein [Gemmatimonadaceae bacterium]